MLSNSRTPDKATNHSKDLEPLLGPTRIVETTPHNSDKDLEDLAMKLENSDISLLNDLPGKEHNKTVVYFGVTISHCTK